MRVGRLCRAVRVGAACLGIFLGARVLAAPESEEGQPVRYRAIIPGVLFGADQRSLLQMQAVCHELGLTEDQSRQQAAIIERHNEKMRAARELTDRDGFVKARQAAWQELTVSLTDNLKPRQRVRLAEIHLQVEGPVAFLREDLPQRLELAGEPIARLKKVAEAAQQAAMQAAFRSLPPEIERPSTPDQVRAFVAGEVFRAGQKDAAMEVLRIWTDAVAEIEPSLSDVQRARYQELRGAPFDLGPVLLNAGNDPVFFVAASLGLTGQRPDPDFDPSVSRPAYTDSHPSVVFDEGHHNFHTAGGRYKAFAALIANDGYRVASTESTFTREVLTGHQVLIVANARAENGNDPQGSRSAFTDDECQVVEAWVEGGGALLLITDHEPFGSASQELAKRFGVEMSTRVVMDSAKAAEQGLLFSRKENLIGDHPVTNGRDDSERIDRVLTFAGQSLKGPAGSIAFLKLSDTATEANEKGEKVSAAGRAQGLALTHGKGRVVVLGEAAQLSAQVTGFPELNRFGMNVPGCDNRQMALNIMHWLSGLTN